MLCYSCHNGLVPSADQDFRVHSLEVTEINWPGQWADHMGGAALPNQQFDAGVRTPAEELGQFRTHNLL